jgi:hypothetical protein
VGDASIEVKRYIERSHVEKHLEQWDNVGNLGANRLSTLMYESETLFENWLWGWDRLLSALRAIESAEGLFDPDMIEHSPDVLQDYHEFVDDLSSIKQKMFDSIWQHAFAEGKSDLKRISSVAGQQLLDETTSSATYELLDDLFTHFPGSHLTYYLREQTPAIRDLLVNRRLSGQNLPAGRSFEDIVPRFDAFQSRQVESEIQLLKRKLKNLLRDPKVSIPQQLRDKAKALLSADPEAALLSATQAEALLLAIQHSKAATEVQRDWVTGRRLVINSPRKKRKLLGSYAYERSFLAGLEYRPLLVYPDIYLSVMSLDPQSHQQGVLWASLMRTLMLIKKDNPNRLKDVVPHLSPEQVLRNEWSAFEYLSDLRRSHQLRE